MSGTSCGPVNDLGSKVATQGFKTEIGTPSYWQRLHINSRVKRALLVAGLVSLASRPKLLGNADPLATTRATSDAAHYIVV
jgi:hypothetical protein